MYAIFANRITHDANYILLNNLRGITLYYKYMKLLNFSHLGCDSAKISCNYASMIHSLCTIAKVQLHYILSFSSLIYVVFALLRSITF